MRLRLYMVKLRQTQKTCFRLERTMRLIDRGRPGLGQRRTTSAPALRQAAEAARQDLAERELRRISLLGTAGVVREITRQIRRDHREDTSVDREVVRDIRGQGGVCRPAEISKLEFEEQIPRSLRGRLDRCLRADELAQEFFDRGMISTPSTDAILEFLGASFRRARLEAPVPEERELKQEARRIVRERVKRTIRELVQTARQQAEAVCPPAQAAVMRRLA